MSGQYPGYNILLINALCGSHEVLSAICRVSSRSGPFNSEKLIQRLLQKGYWAGYMGGFHYNLRSYL